MARWLFGFEVEDIAALTIEHESGAIGNLVTVFNGVQDREERCIEVFFEKGAIEATTDFVVGAPEDSLLRKEASGPAERFDPGELLRKMFAREGVDPDQKYRVYQFFAHRAFALAVEAGDPPSPTMADAPHAHRLVEAAYRSAAAGRPVATSEVG